MPEAHREMPLVDVERAAAWLEEPGSAVPTDGVAPDAFSEAGRYDLYVSYACPWSHRTLIARVLKGLDAVIRVVNAQPVMDEIGWRIGDRDHLVDVYRRSVPGFAGKATVPLLVDAARGAAVSDESAVIARMFERAGGPSGSAAVIGSAAEHAPETERWNAIIHARVNEAVYRVGFAATGEARQKAAGDFLGALARLDTHLESRRHLVVDDGPLEPDWRLWTTLARYDLAYRPLFLGDGAPSLSAFPRLSRFFDELLEVPGIAATFRPDEIVAHYTARVRDLGGSSPPPYRGT